MPAAWRAAIARAEAPYSHLFTPDSPEDDSHKLVEETLEIAYEHLQATSLECWASATDAQRLGSIHLSDDELLIQGEARENLVKNASALSQTYVHTFTQFNTFCAADQWTFNELVFVALAWSWYVLRGRRTQWRKEVRVRLASSKEALEDLMNARCRLASFMSRHHHLVSGKEYLTAAKLRKRNEDARLDVLNPADFTPVEWDAKVAEAARAKREEEDRKAFVANIVREGRERAKRYRMHKDLEELPETEEEVALRWLGRLTLDPVDEPDTFRPDPFWTGTAPPRPLGPRRQHSLAPAKAQKEYPAETACDALMDEVSYFAAVYYHHPAAMELLKREAKSADEAMVLSPESVALRDALTNAVPGDHAHGELWLTDPLSYPQKYLTFASQLFAQLSAERYWATAFPIHEVAINPALMDAVDAFVESRVAGSVQDGVIEDTRQYTFDALLPIGGFNMMKRMRAAVGTNRRETFFHFNAGGATDEIHEQISTPDALRAVGFNPAHPLYDYVVMALLQKATYLKEGDGGIMQRCVIDTNEIVRRGPDFRKETAHGQPRKPLIVNIVGEWRVHAQGVWLRPTAGRTRGFVAAWVLYLIVLKQFHGYSLEDDTSLQWMEEPDMLGVDMPELEVGSTPLSS
jgi:hypothetical protein